MEIYINFSLTSTPLKDFKKEKDVNNYFDY